MARHGELASLSCPNIIRGGPESGSSALMCGADGGHDQDHSSRGPGSTTLRNEPEILDGNTQAGPSELRMLLSSDLVNTANHAPSPEDIATADARGEPQQQVTHLDGVIEMAHLMQRVSVNVDKQKTKMKECIHACQVSDGLFRSIPFISEWLHL